MRVITPAFDLGQEVYLKTDADQHMRLVTQILITPGNMQYQLSHGTGSSWHYDFEITSEANILKKVEQ